jgi:hypothetical protein
MVDDKFRSYRNRDSVAREGSEQSSRGGIGNLLAELARLTGQGDPYADGGGGGASSAVDNRDSVAREGSEQTSRGGIGNLLAELARLTGLGDPYADGGRDGASSALDWAADDASLGQRQQGKDQYVALSRPQPSPVFSRIRPAETIGGRFLPSPQAPTLWAKFCDFTNWYQSISGLEAIGFIQIVEAVGGEHISESAAHNEQQEDKAGDCAERFFLKQAHNETSNCATLSGSDRQRSFRHHGHWRLTRGSSRP